MSLAARQLSVRITSRLCGDSSLNLYRRCCRNDVVLWTRNACRPQHKTHLPRQPTIAQFSTTRVQFKKKDKHKHQDDHSSSKQSKPSSSSPPEDPFDLTPLHDEIGRINDKLKTDLSQLRSGGRFNPAVIEGLRVQPDKSDKTTYPLSDLAQVVPRGGRDIHVLVGDAAHVRAVSSAIMSSTLSLTPQPDPTGQNASLLVVRVPPPTAESRKAVVEEAGKAGEVAAVSLREARAKQHKKFRKMELEKTVRGDDRRREHAKMEDVVKKAAEEVKKVVAAAQKALDK